MNEEAGLETLDICRRWLGFSGAVAVGDDVGKASSSGITLVDMLDPLVAAEDPSPCEEPGIRRDTDNSSPRSTLLPFSD